MINDNYLRDEEMVKFFQDFTRKENKWYLLYLFCCKVPRSNDEHIIK